MGLRISTNVAAITANRHMSQVSEALARNYEHLATGRRIARAADDAAGVAISSRIKARIRSLDQATRNAQDGISLVQTADGSLAELEDILSRMRQLAVQAGNGTLSSQDQDAIQTEFSNLQSSVDAVTNSVKFNGIQLLNDGGNLTLQVGADTAANVDTLVINTYNATGASLAVAALDVGSSGDPNAAITALDTAINSVATYRSELGAFSNRLETTMGALRTRSENQAAANSRIEDVDVATETAALTKNSILQQAAISVLSQANLQPSAALSLLSSGR